MEPEGFSTNQIYPNGISTSLPEDVQLRIIHSIDGLEDAGVLRFGYGIEHTVVEPTQVYPTLETKLVKNLYLAGQINGTTGYEEAAAQGLVAGLNAYLRIRNKEPLILTRANSYIGVLIDDLTTKGTQEPYRMFTSRVEHRLVLREDNADLRLAKIGYEIGLVQKPAYLKMQQKAAGIEKGIRFLKTIRLKPAPEINAKLAQLGSSALKKHTTLEDILKRSQISLNDLKTLDDFKWDIPEASSQQVEIEVKYAGFIERQLREIERFRNIEKVKLPGELDYAKIPGLSREIKEKLTRFKPLNLGQASRISGVTPAAISILMIYLKKFQITDSKLQTKQKSQ